MTIAMAGTVAERAATPQARNMACTPKKSASTPKKRGATVFAMLVEREFMLYAASRSSFSTDSAIIVLVIGTAPLVKKPRIRARNEIIATEGTSASTPSDRNMHTSQQMKREELANESMRLAALERKNLLLPRMR